MRATCRHRQNSENTMKVMTSSVLLMGIILLSGCGTNSTSDTAAPASSSSTADAAAKPASGDSAAKADASASSLIEPPESPLFALEPDFELLGLDAFEIFYSKPAGQDPVWTTAGNGFNCSGKPRGYLYSKQPYENYTLRLDYCFPKPTDLKDDDEFKGNTGVMIHINGSHKQWPVSLEVQGKQIEMGMIKANGGAAEVEIADQPDARLAARKPVGQWNHLEIISRDGTLKALLNDVLVCESKAGELKSGLIGFQSEDFPVWFRNIRIRKDEAGEK